jgi:pyruvate/2-oxoglutarate dehydrogenase complex dihydrolipoamide acyltransferase (E2) component
MSTELRIPSLGASMTEGTLTEWLVSDGDSVKTGDPIYALESEKALQEIESPASGVIRIVGKAGGTYPVGEFIGQIE